MIPSVVKVDLVRRGETMELRIKQGEVAIDLNYFWQPMDTCPTSVKVQLLGKGGVAVYGKWNGRDTFWTHWAPMPKIQRRKDVS